jgi:predicted nicotinamide N-methyase
MPGYSTRRMAASIAGDAYRLRVLSNRQQFADRDGHSARLGISSAQWSLFGQVWPSGILLAQAMSRFDIAGKRILELGCGIGLASLVLQRRGADVVATDIHPLAEVFLAYNAALNDLPALHYCQARWDIPLPSLGQFDLIIASDVLYEIPHAAQIDGMVARHARANAEVLVTDPGRGDSARFTRLLAARGFSVERTRAPMNDDDPPPHRGHLLHFRRAAEVVSA